MNLLKRVSSVSLFITLRFLLQLSGISDYLLHQQILSTPLTSQLRTREALSLLRMGQSPYEGDIVHDPPLVLSLMAVVTEISEEYGMIVLFTVLDILTGTLLLRGIDLQRKRQIDADNKRKFPEAATSEREDQSNRIQTYLRIMPEEEWEGVREVLFALYFLNPLTLLVSATQSSVVLHNYAVALCYSAILGQSLSAPVSLAIATYLNPYTLFLLVPLMLIFRGYKHRCTIPLCLLLYTASLVCLLLASRMLSGGWDFVDSVYQCLLTVSDFTPNLGLFWYFFTLTFLHYNSFFIAVFQLIIPSLTILLACRFHRDPCFLMYVTLSLICIFKSYPSLGDLIIPLLLTFSWSHLYPCMKQVMIVFSLFAATCALVPGFYFLWMYSGFGNANFFFAASLVYTLAHLFLVTDMIRAYVTREKFLDYCELTAEAEVRPVT